MNDQRKRTILSVIGMLALLIACVIGVQAVFAGLGAAIPNQGRGQSTSASASQSTPDGAASAQSAPSFCPFCGENLPSAFQWGQFCPYCGEQVEA